MLAIQNVKIVPVVSDLFAENSYIVHKVDDFAAVIIDPGLSPELLLEEMAARNLRIEAVLLTHGHADHIAGTPAIKSVCPQCVVYVGKNDAGKLLSAEGNLSAEFDWPMTIDAADHEVREGDTITAAGLNFSVLDVPGHSAGHVAYKLETTNPETGETEGDETYLFVGDIIFAGSIGRTDFPDGNSRQLFEGIRTKIFTLSDDVILYPGHGPKTTVGVQKNTNPFFV